MGAALCMCCAGVIRSVWCRDHWVFSTGSVQVMDGVNRVCVMEGISKIDSIHTLLCWPRSCGAGT